MKTFAQSGQGAPGLTRQRTGRRSGYTLLELLIVMGLMLVLISMIWSLIRIYSSYYVSGTRRIERSQLVRSLSQLLNDDLGAAIQDPIHPLSPSEAADDVVRRFGLLGANESLRIDVIQINPLDFSAEATTTRRAAVGPVQDVKMQAPELKTIFYDFHALNSDIGQSQSGLLRREISFEASASESEEQPRANLPGLPNENAMMVPPSLPGPAAETAKRPTVSEQLLQQDDPSAMWAPEVVDFRFRYGNGTVWLESWDSIAMNGLPIAVEITMKLMPIEDVEKLRAKSASLRKAVKSPDRSDTVAAESIRSVGGQLDSGEMGQNSTGTGEMQLIPSNPLPGLPGNQADNQGQTLESLAEELGLAEPMEQRLVVYLATSPLVGSEPIRRPAAPPERKPAVAPTPVSVVPVVPAPTSVPITPPKPIVPSQQWIRK